MSLDRVGRTASTALANDDHWIADSRQAVGKASLAEQLPASAAPLFADQPQWEDIDPSELAHDEPAVEADDAGDDSAALAALDAEPRAIARAAAVEAIPAAPPANAVAVAASADPHKAPYERTTRKKSKHSAKRDRYNREVTEHHAGNQFQISRPGVRVAGKDEMHLKADFAYRYTITSGNKAQVVDKIWEHELQHGKDKDGARLALNPAHTRVLNINGGELECVMSWQGGQSAAWIAIDDLRGNHATIKRAVNRHAAKGQPKAAGKRERDTATPMVFRAVAGPAAADNIDRGRYIVPGQKGLHGNQVSDYLAKSVIRRWSNSSASANAKAATASHKLEKQSQIQAPTGQRDMINVMANLPHDRAAAVAVDVAQPGNYFFVPRGATFRREISMYKRTKTTSNLRQTWVYGFVGKAGSNGEQVADEHRRGWVPLRVLKSA